MPNTYSEVCIHCVFAVRGRENLLLPSFRGELFSYMSGILKRDNAYPLAVNGWHDHVHVLFELSMTMTISDQMQRLKAGSSMWINENKLLPCHFQWQSGYGAFACSKSHRDRAIKYIKNQEEHHSKKSFKEEYIDLLQKAEIAYDEKYLFEFYS